MVLSISLTTIPTWPSFGSFRPAMLCEFMSLLPNGSSARSAGVPPAQCRRPSCRLRPERHLDRLVLALVHCDFQRLLPLVEREHVGHQRAQVHLAVRVQLQRQLVVVHPALAVLLLLVAVHAPYRQLLEPHRSPVDLLWFADAQKVEPAPVGKDPEGCLYSLGAPDGVEHLVGPADQKRLGQERGEHLRAGEVRDSPVELLVERRRYHLVGSKVARDLRVIRVDLYSEYAHRGIERFQGGDSRKPHHPAAEYQQGVVTADRVLQPLSLIHISEP